MSTTTSARSEQEQEELQEVCVEPEKEEAESEQNSGYEEEPEEEEYLTDRLRRAANTTKPDIANSDAECAIGSCCGVVLVVIILLIVKFINPLPSLVLVCPLIEGFSDYPQPLLFLILSIAIQSTMFRFVSGMEFKDIFKSLGCCNSNKDKNEKKEISNEFKTVKFIVDSLKIGYAIYKIYTLMYNAFYVQIIVVSHYINDNNINAGWDKYQCYTQALLYSPNLVTIFSRFLASSVEIMEASEAKERKLHFIELYLNCDDSEICELVFNYSASDDDKNLDIQNDSYQHKWNYYAKICIQLIKGKLLNFVCLLMALPYIPILVTHTFAICLFMVIGVIVGIPIVVICWLLDDDIPGTNDPDARDVAGEDVGAFLEDAMWIIFLMAFIGVLIGFILMWILKMVFRNKKDHIFAECLALFGGIFIYIAYSTDVMLYWYSGETMDDSTYFVWFGKSLVKYVESQKVWSLIISLF